MCTFFDFTIEYTNTGFGLFSLTHFAWLIFALACVLVTKRTYKKADDKKRARLRRFTALFALLLELSRAALFMINGQYDLGVLPLHLCGMAVYFCALHALRGGKLLGQFLYAFCMPGAVSALLFPDWTYYPAAHFMTFCAFLLHILIVCYVLMQTPTDILPDIRTAPRCLLLMLAIAAPVYIFDRLTGTNYMFLNWPSPGSPLEWFAFLGRPGYILGYLPILAAAWAVMYFPFRKNHS